MAGSLLNTMTSLTTEVSWYHWMLGAAVGTLFAFKFLFLGLRKKRLNLPPSPGVIPIVGSFPFLGFRPGEPTYKMINRLAEKFGPIVYLKMGASPTIIVSSSDIAKLVLKDLDHIFGSRPYTQAGKYVGINFHSIVFSPTGPYFKRIRRIYLLELFTLKRVHGTHAIRENGVFDLLGAVYKMHKEGNELINLSALIKDLALTTIIRMIFGWKGGDEMFKNIETLTLDDLKTLIKEVAVVAGEFNAGDFITIARWLDLQGVIKRLKKCNKRMMEIGAAVIEEYERSVKRSPDASDATIFDMLFSLEGDDKLSSEGMAGILYDLIGAGSETTGGTADWAIAELLRQPDLVRKLQAELNNVVGKDRFVTEADIPRLPFLEAVVTETLRLHPPAPLGVPHCTTADCVLAGYDIPAGTITLVNIIAINRDPKHWPEPLQFRPDRFLREDQTSPSGSAYHLLPFSSGRRSCPAKLLGLTFAELIVGNFVHAFDFRVGAGLTNGEIDVTSVAPGIVSIRAQELLVTTTPLLNSDVYGKFLA